MLGGDDWAYQLGAGAKFVGGGVGLYWLYRILVFVCNFLAGRYDARQLRLEEREKRIGKSLGDRLDHLEEHEKEHQFRILLLEEGVAILASELRQQDPGNAKLREVANMLRQAAPLVPGDQALDNLIHRAGDAIERKGDGG